MGISRDSTHKRRATGGKRISIRKKRKFELGRPAAMTKLVSGIAKRVRTVRARGGNLKYRALRLDFGNFSWGSEAIAKKARLLTVVYNASNNELVRTNTLVKNAVVQIDATPFRQWFKKHYGIELGKATAATAATKDAKKDAKAAPKEKTEKQLKKIEAKKAEKAKTFKQRQAGMKPVPQNLIDQFSSGRLLAVISSRPGQHGRADGYILEGPELEFYLRKLKRK